MFTLKKPDGGLAVAPDRCVVHVASLPAGRGPEGRGLTAVQRECSQAEMVA